jgi:hypothetical protein
MRKLFAIGTLLVSILTLNSCAAIFSGTKDRIVVNTTPPGADVFIDNVNMGKSGQEIILKRKYVNQREILLKLEGYQDSKITMDLKIAPAYWLNIPLTFVGLVPGIVGFGVDIGTGAALMPKQTEYNRILTPIKN